MAHLLTMAGYWTSPEDPGDILSRRMIALREESFPRSIGKAIVKISDGGH